ncbi:unnamed protein product [Auanema sp. JU1783]|nr:unnamed protein product [Auanema sp. JU1783]
MHSVALDSVPYSLIVMHCLKYPHNGVAGILMGTSEGGHIKVKEIVPVTHQGNPLSPLLEISLMLVQQRMKEVVGVYFSTKQLRDDLLIASAMKLAEKVAVFNKCSPVVLRLMNENLSDLSENPFKASALRAESLQTYDIEMKVSDQNMAMLQNCVDKKLSYRVLDIENHLSNEDNDYSNAQLIADMKA